MVEPFRFALALLWAAKAAGLDRMGDYMTVLSALREAVEEARALGLIIRGEAPILMRLALDAWGQHKLVRYRSKRGGWEVRVHSERCCMIAFQHLVRDPAKREIIRCAAVTFAPLASGKMITRDTYLEF
jgi:hypothetical protein